MNSGANSHLKPKSLFGHCYCPCVASRLPPQKEKREKKEKNNNCLGVVHGGPATSSISGQQVQKCRLGTVSFQIFMFVFAA